MVTSTVTSPVATSAATSISTKNPGKRSILRRVHVFVTVVGRRSDSVKVEPCGCAQPDESDSSTCLPESGKGDGAAGAPHLSPPAGGQVPGFLSKELPTNSADEAKKSLPGDPGRGMVEPGGRRRYSVTLARLKTQPAPKPLDGRVPALPFFFASKNLRPNPAPCWPVAQDVKDQPD